MCILENMTLILPNSMKYSMLKLLFVLYICNIAFTGASNYGYSLENGEIVDGRSEYIFELSHERQKRDVLSVSDQAGQAKPAEPVVTNDTPGHVTTTTTTTTESTHSQSAAKDPTPDIPKVDQRIPNVGVNGSGIRKNVDPKDRIRVSDPIPSDESNDDFNVTGVFQETPEKLKEAYNITNLKYDNHTYYNSTFIKNEVYFNSHWHNISVGSHETHNLLSNSHRRASNYKLTFGFPFYGLALTKITIATGGFIYTGDHVHNWLAATQYIAPLMANFDTTLRNDSAVHIYDDGSKFSTIWENVALQENASLPFTFAVTLYINGDVVFAYKDIPIPVQKIDDDNHPVKIGISDAYLTDRISYYVRRKTIYEYHRVNFMTYNITSGTILKLTALPTCLKYDNCETCINHNTSFNCSWCDTIQLCSSGTDRYKQDWVLRSCDKLAVSNETQCPVKNKVAADGKQEVTHQIVTIDKKNVVGDGTHKVTEGAGPDTDYAHLAVSRDAAPEHSSLGGLFAAFVAVIVLAAAAAWVLYAFKNPHTKSGQFLIKYRPSQWSWKRGEARYTAATIHM